MCSYDFDGIYDDNCADVFLHDRDVDADGAFDEPGFISTARVSVGAGGIQGDNESTSPAISGDGRFIAFFSGAANLVPSDTNNATDIFVYDRVAQTTERVSVDGAGDQGNGYSYDPAISADGRVVGFYSSANDLVPGDANGVRDVFVHDRQAGETERISVSNEGGDANSSSGFCCKAISLNADGRYVGFGSLASNLVPGDTNFTFDVFVRDRLSGTTARVSVSSEGEEVNDYSYSPVASADGRVFAFESYAERLIANDGNLALDVFVHDFGDADLDGDWDAFDLNDDNDMLTDASESACGSNPLSSASVPERIDTPTDDDGDTLVNEPLPGGAAAYDCDGDGFIGTSEAHVTTSDQDPCGVTGWPADLAPGGLQPNALNLQDISSFIAPAPRKLDTNPNDPGYNVRWDLIPGAAIGDDINLQDMAAVIPSNVGATARPPMFGGTSAFGKTCPWAP